MTNFVKTQLNFRNTLKLIIIGATYTILSGLVAAKSVDSLKHYTDDQTEISFDYPATGSWTIRRAPEAKPPARVIFTNSETRASVIVGFLQLQNVIPDLSEPVILQAAANDIFGSYLRKNPQAKLISSKMLTNTQKINGVEVVYTDVVQGEAWKGRLVAFFKGSKRYDVTTFAPQDRFQLANTEFFSVVLQTLVIGVGEAKKDVLANSKVDCSIFKDATWEEISGYKVKGNIKADPPLNVNFEYTVGKDGTLHCTGWKNLSSKNSLLTATGSISNPKGDEVISFVDAHVSLRLDENATNLDEKVFFEYCLTGKWRVRMFVHGNGYVTKVYRCK